MYTESVICAPEFGPELSLAFGNRSACLYHLGHYKDCLQDIELAFRFRFPKNLAYKLHQRRGQCQTKLGLFKVNHCVLLLYEERFESIFDLCVQQDAQQSFGEAVAALSFVPKLSPEKKDSLVRDINALARESETVARAAAANGDGEDGNGNETFLPPTVPDGGPHPTLVGASSLLDLKNSVPKGRHITTNADVSVGDILFSEVR